MLRQKQQLESRAPFPVEFKLNSDLFQQGLNRVSMLGDVLAKLVTPHAFAMSKPIWSFCTFNKMVLVITNWYMY